LAVGDGKGTILSFIYILRFKEKTPARGEKLQMKRRERGGTPGTEKR
jgi:hypothetical protein